FYTCRVLIAGWYAMSVITISRQLGSLGDEVAHAVADKLDYQIIGRDLINQAAVRANVPEVALAAIDDLGLLDLHPPPESIHAYQNAISEIMHELAAVGNVVIVGRAGQVILRDNPQVLHVKVIAPERMRFQRVAQQQNTTLECAQAQVLTSDKTRKNYLNKYYQVRWDDPQLYDLIVNTARLLPQQAACLIGQALNNCIAADNSPNSSTEDSQVLPSN
ncbi:MAG: cytidylate kinase-like family protein, partial [Anaerolineales bacterium]|nr:cytidylate kinase-like family protein [Anaerolineales bacterium]